MAQTCQVASGLARSTKSLLTDQRHSQVESLCRSDPSLFLKRRIERFCRFRAPRLAEESRIGISAGERVPLAFATDVNGTCAKFRATFRTIPASVGPARSSVWPGLTHCVDRLGTDFADLRTRPGSRRRRTPSLRVGFWAGQGGTAIAAAIGSTMALESRGSSRRVRHVSPQTSRIEKYDNRSARRRLLSR